MKIWTFSDTHYRDGLAALQGLVPCGIPDADICVVPGDFIEGDPADAVSLLDDLIGVVMPVIYVLGNHEYYHPGRDMLVNRELAQRAAARTEGRVRVLDDSAVDIGGVRFIGSTLWYDLEIFGADDESMAHSWAGADRLTDSRFLYDSVKRWTPGHARRQHLQSRAWLDQELAASALPTVVVTHHAPHRGSIAERFARDYVTAGFASDLSDMIERHQPALWVHGHMHDSFDYRVGKTRVLCNPKGYGRENEAGFDPAMVIEVDTSK